MSRSAGGVCKGAHPLCAHPCGKAQELLWSRGSPALSEQPLKLFSNRGFYTQHGFSHLSYAEAIRSFQNQHFFNTQYFLCCLRKMIQHYFCLADLPVDGGRDESWATLASLCSHPGRCAEPKQETQTAIGKKICHPQSHLEKTSYHLRHYLALFKWNKSPCHHHLKPFKGCPAPTITNPIAHCNENFAWTFTPPHSDFVLFFFLI